MSANKLTGIALQIDGCSYTMERMANVASHGGSVSQDDIDQYAASGILPTSVDAYMKANS
jgi:hypothetical protein